MKFKEKIFLATILVALIGVAAGQIYRPENYTGPETEHFEIKIVSDYPSQGSIETLRTVQDKRQIILRNDLNADLRKRCNILYKSSITKNPNPCGELN